jgi:hypothetical protein
MDAAEALDATIDYFDRHGFLVGFILGAVFVSILWVI